VIPRSAIITSTSVSCLYNDSIHVALEFLTDDAKIANLLFGMHNNPHHLLEVIQPKPKYYTCLYCMQANLYESLFCTQCGGPRGVILGEGV